MPIDDRLRASLHWDPTTMPAADPELLDAVVARMTWRRRIRVAAVATAAAALLIAAVAAPWAISGSQRGSEPIHQPTHSPHWVPSLAPASPLDQHWAGAGGSRAERLAAVDGTDLEDYGQEIYTKYLADAITDLQFANGAVRLSTAEGGGRYLGDNATKALLHGTFTVRGHTVAMRFDEVPGTTVFRWSRVDDRGNERLELRFVSTTARSLYGAPAEVFLRLWSAEPFWIWG